jgi:opacity protein-like surface antigen
MKKTCCTLLCAASLAASPLGVLAADVTVDSSTLLGYGKRDVSGGSNETLAPATQFLGLTVDKLADGNLSLHFYGWGRADLADNSFNNNSSDGSLTYGYLQYRFNQAGAGIRAGRHFIHEGIVNEQVDGVSFRTDLPMGFGLSAFGGATVHTKDLRGENSDGKGDTLYGGRVNYRYKGMLDIGLSAVSESSAPTLVHPAPVTPLNGSYSRVGSDIWYTPLPTVDIIGQSSYNTETSKIANHSYLLNYKPVPKLVLTGEYNYYSDSSYLYPRTSLSARPLNPNDKSSTAGFITSYEISKNLEAALDYKHYTREFGSADRLGGDLRVKYQDNSIRGGVGYHYLDAGQGFAITPYTSGSYQELRCYVMQDTKSYFGSVDILGQFFKDDIYNESSAWEAIASLGYHITPALALSGDISYGKNPQFTEEVKGLLRLTYNMTFNGTGGKK